MLYVKSRKNFEMRREKRFITLPCAKKNTQQSMAVCAHDKKVDVCPIEIKAHSKELDSGSVKLYF